MNRRFTLVTVCLTATVTFLIGVIIAGSLVPTPALSSSALSSPLPKAAGISTRPAATGATVVNFADVAERINPSVVNIDATSRTGRSGRYRPPRALPAPVPDGLPDPPDLFGPPGDTDRMPRRGSGSGFIVDTSGHILTNHHVIEGAERLTVKLADGRAMRATVVGSDPDTDIAVIKVDATAGLPVAAMGDSDHLRVGEWVCAIGNPLAYEHTVTVGVVSYIGRKLFDTSLDNYIQTDAAINFGNSGGPLINARGEVIGINAAISSRASNIGFAVPINQARAILPQLIAKGRVSRGYIGVTLASVDPDLQKSLKLPVSRGALVQDVAEGSPAERAGVRVYDVIVGVDDNTVDTTDQLIRLIAARQPGAQARVRVLRDGHPLALTVKLAERPPRDGASAVPWRGSSPGENQPAQNGADHLGLRVRDLDRTLSSRLRLPSNVDGVVVMHVEPMSPAFDGEIARGHVVMEINRQPVRSAEDYRRITTAAAGGDVLAFYVYVPGADSPRALKTVRLDSR
ncbi:MAG: trypsin-like peptidase domain-containing protein [Acidobacteria bacterium]|nr:trypsin-like peptidase domain-containing protein [Acidobacteriota bacterium]